MSVTSSVGNLHVWALCQTQPQLATEPHTSGHWLPLFLFSSARRPQSPSLDSSPVHRAGEWGQLHRQRLYRCARPPYKTTPQPLPEAIPEEAVSSRNIGTKIHHGALPWARVVFGVAQTLNLVMGR